MTSQINGNRLLIAISNHPAALDLVRTVACNLSEPEQAHITLMHYLVPITWEHGGDDSPQAEAERLHIEEIARQNEEYVEEKEDWYFDHARQLLEKAGVPAKQIKTCERWDAMDAAHAVLDDLRSGNFSTVVIGQHHHNLLDSLLGTSMASFLQKHSEGVQIWSVPQMLQERTQ